MNELNEPTTFQLLTPFQLTVLEAHVKHCRALRTGGTVLSIGELEELLRVYRFVRNMADKPEQYIITQVKQSTVVTVTEGTEQHEYLTLPMPSKNDCTCQPTLVHQEDCSLHRKFGDATTCYTCFRKREGDSTGHDVDDGFERRWYCSPECYSR